MSSSISKQLRQTYDLASLRREAAMDLSSDEWKQYQKIRETHDMSRRFEIRQYEIEYQTRLEAARELLIDKAAARSLDFKHRWFGSDRFNKSEIDRQAHRQVLSDHRRKIASLDRIEQHELTALLDEVQKRHADSEKPKRDFRKAANRRSGIERRAMSRRR